jgi:glycosyltransferase involved in cell wall biosynthesis
MRSDEMKKILILTNSLDGFYRFRHELITELLKKKYTVYLSAPMDVREDYYRQLGVVLIDTKINRRGINPLKDMILFLFYKKLINSFKPDIILTYTIKPNIYGGLASRLIKTPYLVNVTGLGTAVENKGILQIITTRLYKVALKKAYIIFFQNIENMNFMLKKGIKGKHQMLLPGSGINVERFRFLEYPNDEVLHFLFIGRVMKAKGIDYYLEAAKHIKLKYPNTVFHILGAYEEDYKSIFDEYQSKGIIKYHGSVDNVKKFLLFAHCTIHPTYYPEGMSNVLLESAASGRPVIASNRSGCKEIIEDGKNGFLIEPKNIEDLINKIEVFINVPLIEKRQMGIYGRKKVVREFNRDIVINAYLNEIEKVGS